MASTRRIQLTLFSQRAYDAQQHDGVRVRIEAAQPHLMDVHVFRYLQRPVAPGQASPVSDNDGVCSSADLEEFPVGAPAVNANPPWFRLSYLDVVCRSWHEAEAVWATVQAEVGHLIASLNAQDDLAMQPPVWVGALP